MWASTLGAVGRQGNQVVDGGRAVQSRARRRRPFVLFPLRPMLRFVIGGTLGAERDVAESSWRLKKRDLAIGFCHRSVVVLRLTQLGLCCVAFATVAGSETKTASVLKKTASEKKQHP